MIYTSWGYLVPHITKSGDIFIVTEQESIILLNKNTPMRALTPIRNGASYKHFYNLAKSELWFILDYNRAHSSYTTPEYSEALDVCYDILIGNRVCNYTFSEGYVEEKWV